MSAALASNALRQVMGSDAGFSSAVKSVTDVFLKTFWSGPGSVATLLTDPAVFSRLGKNGERYQNSADVILLAKEVEKLNFLVNLKTYKHEVEEMITQQCTTKSQLEVRLTAFFKQLKRVFQADLNSFIQKLLPDLVANSSASKGMHSGMDHSQSEFSLNSSVTGLSGVYGAKAYRAMEESGLESSRNYGPSPRVGSADSKGTHFSVATSATSGMGIPIGFRAQGRVNELKGSAQGTQAVGTQKAAASGSASNPITIPNALSSAGNQGSSGIATQSPASTSRAPPVKGSLRPLQRQGSTDAEAWVDTSSHTPGATSGMARVASLRSLSAPPTNMSHMDGI
eukprot:TRINITY_DN10035_c0_g1_i5.p1 TRINITY_DN10035_c0_g1~~TRINITY_DN10035_c0_g1_i5.p1  ORF type:complete len:340 (+),score=54.28 TRINITY_DN10035_c0_g1_i5:107-1126(+)